MNEKLRQEIENIENNDYDAIIDFYESNIEVLSNNNLDKEALVELANIKISYIFSLYHKNHYTKAYSNRGDIDIIVNKLNDTDEFSKLNELYLFVFGMITSRLKKYEESQEYFSQLVKKDPDNDMYRGWYDSNDDYLFAKKSRIISFLGIAILLYSFFNPFLELISWDIMMKLNAFGFSIMILGFYGYKLRRLLKKYKIVYK